MSRRGAQTALQLTQSRVESAGFPTNFGAQPLVDIRRSFSSLNSMQKLFSIIAAGRRVVGAVELDRLSRNPLFENLSVFNIRTLLNHLDASIAR